MNVDQQYKIEELDTIVALGFDGKLGRRYITFRLEQDLGIETDSDQHKFLMTILDSIATESNRERT